MVSPFVPLAAAAVVVGILSLVGFVVYEIFNDIAEKTAQKMEKKNITFGKEGVRVGIKEVKNEDYVEKTQRCAWPPFIAFVCVFLRRASRPWWRACRCWQSAASIRRASPI